MRASSASRSRSAYSRCSHASVEDAQQALTRRVAAGIRPAGPPDRFGAAVQRPLGQALNDLAHGGHPVAAQLEHRIERGSRGAVAGHPGMSGISSHGRPRASHGEGSPRIADLMHESVANTRWRSVSMNDPLATDRPVQQLRLQAAGGRVVSPQLKRQS